jgi:hypothetical protein
MPQPLSAQFVALEGSTLTLTSPPSPGQLRPPGPAGSTGSPHPPTPAGDQLALLSGFGVVWLLAALAALATPGSCRRGVTDFELAPFALNHLLWAGRAWF